MRYTLLICAFLLIPVPRLAAQVPPRAQRLYDRALQYRARHKPEKAEEALRQAIRAFPAYADAYGMLGRWLSDQHRFREAAAVYIQAERSCPDGRKVFARPAAMSLLGSGDPDGALARIPPGSDQGEWGRIAAQARFIRQAMRPKDSLAVLPVDIPGRINTGDPETFPFLSADGQIFYFTRMVNGMDEDIYYARRDSCGGWLSAKNMGMPPNSSAAEAAAALSADRHYLFMMRCDNRSDNGWAQGGCDLYMAYTADSLWSVPLSFGATINTPSYEGMPALSSDNRELFFVSDRPGGFGGFDLWSSRFEHGLWQLPRNLGPSVNTAGRETAPFICADNETLYFASTGHTGMGGSDLFMCRKVNDTTWSTPVNLGWPINTACDETSLSLNAAADTAYFASDRDSLPGRFDLYQVSLPETLKPGTVGYYSGCVYDSIERTRLNYANIYFTDSATGRESYQVVSNRGDGSYMIALPAGHTYSLLLSRIGYQQLVDTIRCAAADVQHPAQRSFALLPVGYEQPVTDTLLLTVYFRKNSTVLTDSDKVQVAQALQPWLEAKHAQILINGYTDNSGTPLVNEQLSYARARAVSELARGKGLPEALIQIQGWGEANPVAENDSDEHRDKNRRVEIVLRH